MRNITGVIVAAGRGNRLINSSDIETPKPLYPINGVPMLCYIIKGLKTVGIDKIIIVTGYLGNLISEYSEEIEDEIGVKIKILLNKNWEKGNGTSLMCGMKAAHQNISLVSMADHIHPVENYEAVINQRRDAMLLTDFNPNKYLDLNDATKVKISSNWIQVLDKNLDPYDAIDTGLFLFSPQAISKLKSIYHLISEPLSISKLLNTAINSGLKLRSIPVQNHMWIDIDTPQDLQIAQKIF